MSVIIMMTNSRPAVSLHPSRLQNITLVTSWGFDIVFISSLLSNCGSHYLLQNMSSVAWFSHKHQVFPKCLYKWGEFYVHLR